ncbi:MAG: radical SAM protein [Coprobacillus sp.]
MNKRMIVKMITNKTNIKTFLSIHKSFKVHDDYKIRNMIKCGLNIIKNDRLVMHDGYFLVNSFIPPINSEAFQTIVKQVPGVGKEFFENHTNGTRLAPISTYVAATDKCMYHCWHCSAHKFMKDASLGSEFTTNQLKEVVVRLQDLGVGIIGFTGGEPLLRDDLEDIISTVDKRSVSYVFTTGFNLTYQRALSLKKAGLFGIAISIDSLDKDKHNAMRRNDKAYDYAIQAIENAKKAGLYTMTQTVCTRELLLNGGIFDLAKYLKTLNVDEMRIMEPLPCGALKDKMDEVLTELEKDKLKQLHVILNKDKQYPKVSVFPYFESEDQFGCGAGVQHSYVDAKGNFGPCDFMDVTYGNILEENPVDIWERITIAVDGPHCQCVAKHCDACKQLPKFYRLMRGK